MKLSSDKLYRVLDYSVFFITPFFQVINHIKSLLLLLLTLVLSAAFVLFRDPDAIAYQYPDADPKSHPFFYFSNVELYTDTHAYFIIVHLILFVFSIDRFCVTDKFRTALIIFIIIQGIGIIDYLLAYGETWFWVGTVPVNWNILKVVIFVLAIMNEVFLYFEKKWS